MNLPLDVEIHLPPYALRQEARDAWVIRHEDGRLYSASVVDGKLRTAHYGRTWLSKKRTGFTWQPVKEGKEVWLALDNALRTIGAYAPCSDSTDPS